MAQPDMLREQEAIEFINTVQDPVTNALVHHAHFYLLRRFAEAKRPPIADFDVRFFVEVIEEACHDHDTLKQLLNGERVGAWPDGKP